MPAPTLQVDFGALRAPLAVLAVLGVGVIAGVNPHPAFADCETGPATFTYTDGSEQCYTVPRGVSTLHAVVVGASGASGGTNGQPGGKGGLVSGNLTKLTSGETLYVNVAASGGGASDVRTQPGGGECGPYYYGASSSLQSRLIVAGGGGNAGTTAFSGSLEYEQGGAGGNAGYPTGAPGGAVSASAVYHPYLTGTANGGSGGTQTAGGAGGTATVNDGSETTGGGGMLGCGGRADADNSAGIGGDGWYGGGDGGEADFNFGDYPVLFGGGAGGSDHVASSVKSASYGLDSSGTPEVDLTPVDVAPKITSGTSTSFTAGRAGLFTVKATGYPIPSLSESGALPAGVRFTDNGDGTATLSGTPAIDAAGTYSITLTGSNGVAPDATRAFTLTVAPAMFTLSVKLSGTGTGTVVESSPQSPPTAGVINCPGKCSAKFPAGQQVVLQVDPASGSSLSTVSGCNQMSGDACTITLNANATVKATFATGGAAVATGPHPLAIRAQG